MATSKKLVLKCYNVTFSIDSLYVNPWWQWCHCYSCSAAEMLSSEGAGAAISTFCCQSLPTHYFQDGHDVADGEANEPCPQTRLQAQTTVCMFAFGKKSDQRHYSLPLYSAWEVVSLLVLWTLVLSLAQPNPRKSCDWKYVEVQKTALSADTACIFFAWCMAGPWSPF